MVTQSQIQSIVDGECSHEVRAAILQEIESKPEKWRMLALALLEEHEWARQIASLSKYRSADKSASIAPTIATKENGLLDQERRVVLADSSSKSGVSNRESVKGTAPWLSALAASFLLGVGIYGGSFLPGWNAMKSSDATPEVAGIQDRNQRSERDSPKDGRLDSDMRMLVSGPNKEREEIPIYDLNAIDHDVFVKREMYEVAKINQRLRKEGFELDVRPEYYTGKLNDGRQLIVPVKHVGLKPYGL